MFAPRVRAAIFVLLLIGVLASTGVVLLAWLGPASAHGTNVMHVGGYVTHLGPGKDFLFETDSGQTMAFACDSDCRASQRHLLRHLKEKAHTDVYFIAGPGREWLVVDVD